MPDLTEGTAIREGIGPHSPAKLIGRPGPSALVYPQVTCRDLPHSSLEVQSVTNSKSFAHVLDQAIHFCAEAVPRHGAHDTAPLVT